MPEMTSYDLVYAPALFPEEGRLPTDKQAVWENYYKQTAEHEKYRQQLNAARGFRGVFTSAQFLPGSLFLMVPKVPHQGCLLQATLVQDLTRISGVKG